MQTKAIHLCSLLFYCRFLIFFAAFGYLVRLRLQSNEKWESGRRSAHRILLDAAGLAQVLGVVKDRLDELTKQTVHVGLTAGKQPVQEGDVSTVSRQQQGNVRQPLDCGEWEGCEGTEALIKLSTTTKNLESPSVLFNSEVPKHRHRSAGHLVQDRQKVWLKCLIDSEDVLFGKLASLGHVT